MAIKNPRTRKDVGQALVELGLITPILLLLLLGAAELGAAFQAKITITNAAREGARLSGRGNIFTDDQVLQVVAGQSRSVDILGQGTVLLTSVRSTEAGFVTYQTSTLCGGEPSRVNLGTLEALHAELVASEPGYLAREAFVIVEIVYPHRTLTGLLGDTITMHAFTVMPVSAPS